MQHLLVQRVAGRQQASYVSAQHAQMARLAPMNSLLNTWVHALCTAGMMPAPSQQGAAAAALAAPPPVQELTAAVQRHIQSAESHHELVHRLRNALATANVMNS